MKFKIKETYLLLMIVIGLVSLSVYTTYAMFTASTTIENVVNFVTSLNLNTNLSEYELITLSGNETKIIELNVTNSYSSTLCYGIWYEVVSGNSSNLDIGTFTEKNTTLPSGQITANNSKTAVVGMSNGSSSSITLKLGTIGREVSGSSCSLGITSPRSLIGTEWADVILVTDEYLSEHTTTASQNYSWSSNTSGSTTLSLEPGTYKLEVWGAEGGEGSNGSVTYAGGKGGYSYGTLKLTDDTTVYAYVGGKGTAGGSTSSIKTGGYNGGGNSSYNMGGAGGGASDIRIGTNSLYARVIVAGGGGGGANYNSTYIGGAGGGTLGIDGTGYNTDYNAKAGSSTSGGTAGGYSGNVGSAGTFGQGGAANTTSNTYSCSGGGGGGWYGGGGGGYRSSSIFNFYGVSGGGGGSGYVYTSSTASNYPSGCLLNSSHYLTYAATIAGTNSFTDYDGTTVTGHSGNGAVKITGTTSAIYSIPTLTGLTNLTVALGQTANFTKNVEVVCASGTTGCSIVEYPSLNTSTLEVGTYTAYYVVKGSDNKKYKYARTINVIDCTQLSTINFSYTGNVQTYTLTCPGEYKLDVWGAQGGSISGANLSQSGGKGGYSYGNINITDATTLYIYVGGVGSNGTGGFNGGGAGGSGSQSNSATHGLAGYGGGGATDIRVGTDSLYARVIVAGGGGGATSGYDGGAGGGSSALDGSGSTGTGYNGYAGKAGTTNLGGAGGAIRTSEKDSSNLLEKIMNSSGGAGGGGGWYGGGGGGGASCDRAGYDGTVGTAGVFGTGGTGGRAHVGNYYSGGYSGGGAGGGSGYVYTSSTASNYPDGCLLTSDYYLTNATTIAGDQSFTDFSGVTVTGHSGNGYARITYLGI